MVAFKTLLRKIGPCDIFHNKSNCSQAPVKWQLLVALENLGLLGIGGGGGESDEGKAVLI